MNILVIDDDNNIRNMLADILKEERHKVFTAVDGIKGIEYLKKEKIEIVFLDLWMPQMGGIDILKKIKEEFSHVEVVMISGQAKINHAVNATKIGAYDFIEKPISVYDIISVVKEIEKKKKNNHKHTDSDLYRMDILIGESPPIRAVKKLIENAAKSDARVLITGENGTGKEIIAREIFFKSSRSKKPFICVNCAAIPENLIESELFGHIKGSFTGSLSDRIGKFELANTGTLFLDEIADMSLATQAKVLRVLQELKVTKIGSTESIVIDVRIISATNKDLREEIKKGNFREDLYYRLNVIPFYLPALRERKEDIGLLVEYFMNKLAEKNKTVPKRLSDEALDYLRSFSWPGNVRQLSNIVERLNVMISSNIIEVDDVKKYIDEEALLVSAEETSKYENYKLNLAKDEFEKDFIIKKLVENNFNITKTAKVLGIYPSNLYSKINKLGIIIDELKKK